MQKPFIVKGLGWPNGWGKGLTVQAAIRKSELPAGDPVRVWLVNPEAEIDAQGELVATSAEDLGSGEISADRKSVKFMHPGRGELSVPNENPLPTPNEQRKIRPGKMPTQPNPEPGNTEMTETTETKARAPKAFRLEAAENAKAPAAGSKRHTAYELIARPEGATIEQVMEATGWNKRNATEGVRLLNKHNGLGLVGDEDGVIKLA